MATPVVCLPANNGEFEDPYQVEEESEHFKDSWDQPAFYSAENSDQRTIWYHTGWYFEDQAGREKPNSDTLFGQRMSDEQLTEQLESKAGIAKLHQQFWHLNADAIFKRIQPLVLAGRMSEVKRLCEEVVTSWSPKNMCDLKSTRETRTTSQSRWTLGTRAESYSCGRYLLHYGGPKWEGGLIW